MGDGFGAWWDDRRFGEALRIRQVDFDDLRRQGLVGQQLLGVHVQEGTVEVGGSTEKFRKN